jgi:Leucine-rich repeat (LRR) protein
MASGNDRCDELLKRLLAEPDAEKRVKAIRKKFRDIEKLKEQKSGGKTLEPNQEQKINGEAALLQDLAKIEAEFPPRADSDEESSEPEPVPKSKAKGKAKAEFKPAPRKKEQKAEEPSDDEEVVEEKKADKLVSSSLKTKRQQQATSTASSKSKDYTVMDAKAATWPEVQDIASSGSGGVDKGRQKHALVVNRGSDKEYEDFDNYIWKCDFLTRLELKLPPGVLAGDDFQHGFPGKMTDLLEVILKENALTVLPPSLGLCHRLRSLDVSHNKLAELPDVETWSKLAGCLENLDLAFNCLSSVESLEPLSKLSTLKLDGNKLTSLDGISWSQLKQLTSLTAVGNEIAELPSEIGLTAESMMHLDLSENKLVALPEEVSELKKLKEMKADGNPIKDQKVVKYLEKGGRGLKELFVYLQKPQRGGKKK